MLATCTDSIGRGSTPAMMMPLPYPGGCQLGAGLRDDLAAVREEQHGFVLRHHAADDVGGDHRLAAAGRCDQQDSRRRPKGLLDAIDNVALIGAQLDH
jgi:hypothetical protein